jgi:hypothetical protein
MPITEKELFQPDYTMTGDILLKKQNTLRKLVGTLGMILPVSLVLFLQIDTRFDSVLPSISHYYYTRAYGVFVICVSLLAIFLLVYKGEGLMDYYLSSLAGFSALCVVLFPTGNLCGLEGGRFDNVTVTILTNSAFRSGFHYLSAAIFLGSLAMMSLCLFTRSDTPPSKRPKSKRIRNRIYRVCAGIMFLAMIVILLGNISDTVIDSSFYNKYSLTFWMEALAVEAFGVSWIVKGRIWPDSGSDASIQTQYITGENLTEFLKERAALKDQGWKEVYSNFEKDVPYVIRNGNQISQSVYFSVFEKEDSR